ncbi:MAG: radical SAM protein [Planctomycetota bacterium]|nr:MAG: radical SAM protein [Planctomycetota bacterium]
MVQEDKYLYGPVPSRRLGRSLGVDIVPSKVCTLDCIYCQLGKTTYTTIERKDFVPVGEVLAELKEKLARGLDADFITISGSGEPTLNSRLGELIDGIKKITDIPVAVVTNGTLLYRQDVRADCARADVVLPSLDAGDEQTFQRINRPHPGLSVEKLVNGLCAFRDEFSGQLWLEVFLIEGFNTDTAQIDRIEDAINRIRPDKIQLNTAVRPAAEPEVKTFAPASMQAIAKQFGDKCKVVPCYSPPSCASLNESTTEDVLADQAARRRAETLLSMLKRRPCSLSDICSALGIRRDEALKYINHFQQQGVIGFEQREGTVFFKAN